MGKAFGLDVTKPDSQGVKGKACQCLELATGKTPDSIHANQLLVLVRLALLVLVLSVGIYGQTIAKRVTRDTARR